MKIVTVTPPPYEPVTFEQALYELRTDECDVDRAEVERQIRSARRAVENLTDRAIVSQVVMATGNVLASDFTYLRRSPFISMVSVKYYDAAGVLQTIDPANYSVDSGSDLFSRLNFLPTYSIGSLAVRNDAIQVQWRAGYPPTVTTPTTRQHYIGNVPEDLIDGILMTLRLIADRFDPNERESVERARNSLIAPYRVFAFA